MKRKKWGQKVNNSDWEKHQQRTTDAIEALGYECVQEITRPHNGGIKAAKGKCDIQVLKNDEPVAYFECKSTKDALGLPEPGKKNPDIKQHQMDFLAEMTAKGYKAGFIIRYYSEEWQRVFYLSHTKLTVLFAENFRVRDGKVIKPTITLKRLEKYGQEMPIIDDVYDFRTLSIERYT